MSESVAHPVEYSRFLPEPCLDADGPRPGQLPYAIAKRKQINRLRSEAGARTRVQAKRESKLRQLSRSLSGVNRGARFAQCAVNCRRKPGSVSACDNIAVNASVRPAG